MWDLKQKATKEQTKRLIDIDNRMTVTRGEGGERVKGVKHMVMHGSGGHRCCVTKWYT